MKDSFSKFGGISAILVGLLSILFAIFYLVIAKKDVFIGMYGSWVIFSVSGVFSSAAYVALYQRVRTASEGYALWALLLGVASSFATLIYGAYQGMLLSSLRTAMSTQEVAIKNALLLPSQVNPAGLAAFLVAGIVTLVFSWIIVGSGALPKTLGYLGIFNALLLIILYSANVFGEQRLVLISGGLTSIIVGPIWWIWIGTQLMKKE